ncbi:hypothetical protein UFOVP181_377 [uncultured Caudovirales phage]|uniref:Uncharacterized protein n=1 Tax=uncultured Caudovirales phage TaxID=2100421 RepID=A0A6J5KV32_9CAUD|nr:hypothetical protein UFOVP57_262 [uncultured Caudovirales phage]CAB5209238.1 hypothetical protein UFOVP181_377 [uncultured Caudovirales phage]
MRTLKQPIKVIDNFFETAEVWRHYALKQDFARDENSTWPGTRTATLDQLNIELFNSLATSIINHMHDKKYFSLLKINFALVDTSYNIGWMHQDEPQYNVAGVIFLNKNAPANTGLSFYHKIADNNQDYNSIFFEELKADLEDRKAYVKFKEEQRTLFKRNMTVENVFNRCVMFPPDQFHAADGYFGNTIDDSRLTINFFGIAV